MRKLASVLILLLIPSILFAQIEGGGFITTNGGENLIGNLNPSVSFRADENVYQDAAIQFEADDRSLLQIADANQTGLDPGTDDFLIACWVFRDTATAGYLWGKYTSAGGTGYYAYVAANGQLAVTLSDGTNAYLGSDVGDITVGEWTFVAVWFDRNDKCKAYVGTGGTLTQVIDADISSHTGSVANSADFRVGAHNSLNQNYFDGRMDELCFFKGADLSGVTSDLITSLYNSGEGKLHDDLTTAEKTYLVSWWGLGEPAASQTRYDSHGGNHLTPSYGELVTNGTFTGNSTGWTEGANWAYDTNNETATAADENLSQSTVVPTPGKLYDTSYTITAFTGGSVRLTLGGVDGTTRSSAATFDEQFRATSAATLNLEPVTTLTATVDDASVAAAEILPAAGIVRGRASDSNFAVELNGTTQYLSYSGTALDPGTGDIAVGFPLKLNEYQTGGAVVLSWGEGIGSTKVLLQIGVGATGVLSLRWGDGANTPVFYDSGSFALETDRWYFVIANCDRDGNAVVYVDNVARITGDISGLPASMVFGDCVIGRYAPGSYNVSGVFDNLFSVNRLLTVDEIAWMQGDVAGEWRQYAECGQAGNDGETLVDFTAFVEFDAASDLGADSTANGNDFTPVGSPSQTEGVNYIEGAVSYWASKYGSLAATKTTLAQRPTYHTVGGPNNGPYISFDGSDDALETALVGLSEATIFIVGKLESEGIPIGVEDIGNRSYISSTSDPYLGGGAGDHDDSTIVSTIDPSDDFHVVCLTYGDVGEVESLYADGSLVYSGTRVGSISTAEDYYIGALNSAGTASDYCECKISHAIVYPSKLSDVNRASVTGILQQLYNLAP